MAKNSKGRLALLVFGVVCSMPAGAFAGPLVDAPAEPRPVYSAPHYSPWHYWTPTFVRWYDKCRYDMWGHRYTLDYYPPGPSGPAILSHPGTTVDPGALPGGGNQPPPARSPAAGDR